MNKLLIFLFFIFAGAVFVGVIFWPRFFHSSVETACTLEAKLCPDGSAVGRTGPNCEFAECPQSTTDASWQIFHDDEKGLSFRYPESLTTRYIRVLDWPPQVQITSEPFTCTEGGSEIDRAGQTRKRMVDDRSYCVTTITEGAAGSVYTQYAYAFQKATKVIIFTFTTRAVQCGNYDDLERRACEAERESFDIEGVVDRIAESITFE